MSRFVQIARANGVAGYIGDGSNRWPAVHRSNAAQLVKLALNTTEPGSILHAIGEEGVTIKVIAEAIGRGLGLPVRSVEEGDVEKHFGWIGAFYGMDLPTSSRHTQMTFEWNPNAASLIEDLDGGSYFRN